MFRPYLRYNNEAKSEAKTRIFNPPDLRQLYNLPPPIQDGPPAQIVVISLGGGLFGTLDASSGTLTNGDVQTAWQQWGLSQMPVVRIQTLAGATNNPQPDDGATFENTLDVEFAGAQCPHSVITLLIAPNTGDGFTSLFEAALALNPSIVSCSWGSAESENDPTSLQQVNNLLATFVQRGITVCCAAGDNGANDGTSSPTADFPCSSPNVLACGGTTLYALTNQYDASTQETVWNDAEGATGGGQSAVFPKPSYQSQIALSNMRMVPDIALVADPATGVNCVVNGQTVPIGGTSIVAPFMAGFLASIRLQQFVNPLIYAAPMTCFHDITVGNNGGENAGKGFDEASGLGSINATSLVQSFGSSSQVPVTSIHLVPLLHVGSTYSFGVAILPSNATTPDLQFTSSNPAVASIDPKTPLVTTLTKGSVTFTVTALDTNAVVDQIQCLVA